MTQRATAEQRLGRAWDQAGKHRPVTVAQIGRMCRSRIAGRRLLGLMLARRETEQGRRDMALLRIAQGCVEDRDNDCRWQAMVVIGDFIADAPDAVWAVVRRYGMSADEDMQAAVACVLLEHLFDQHPQYVDESRRLAKRSLEFRATLRMCWR